MVLDPGVKRTDVVSNDVDGAIIPTPRQRSTLDAERTSPLFPNYFEDVLVVFIQDEVHSSLLDLREGRELRRCQIKEARILPCLG